MSIVINANSDPSKIIFFTDENPAGSERPSAHGKFRRQIIFPWDSFETGTSGGERMRCRKVYLTCLFAFALSIAIGVTPTSAASPWRSDFEQAKADAKRLNLPLLIHFYADWCGPCRQMERDVLSSASLAKQLNGKFVAVKVNSDRREDLVNRYRIGSLPSDVFVSPSGRILSRNSGAQGKSSYLTYLATIDAKWSRSQTTRIVRTEIPKTAPGVSTVKVESGHSKAVSSGKQSPGKFFPSIPIKRILGLEGYCPVYLFQNRNWKKGSPQFAVEYKGVVYHFSGAVQRDQFESNPSKYAPRLLGCDPVILTQTDLTISGDIKYGAYYDNELFLFTNADSRKQFRKQPPRYTRTHHVLRIDEIDKTQLR
jgi:thiol-disulfide isomerase/thioredoxin/YHS domain-containing protein